MRISTLINKMNSVKDFSLVCLFFVLTFSISVFSYSTNTYAYDIDVFPRDTSNTFKLDTEVHGNCQLLGYVFNDGASVIAGTNVFADESARSSLYPCGYRWLNNKLQYYRHSTLQKQALYISGSTQQPTTDTFSVTSNHGLGGYDTFKDKDFNLYKAIETISVLPDSASGSGYVFPSITNSFYECENKVTQANICDPRSLVLISYDMDSSNSFEFDFLKMKFNNFNQSTYPFTSDVYMKDINDSTFHYCSTGLVNSVIDDFIISVYPDFYTGIDEGYKRCVVGTFVPLSPDGSLNTGNKGFTILPAPASDYSRDGWTTVDHNYDTNILGNLPATVLPKYGYPWPMLYFGQNYKAAGSQTAYLASLQLFNPRVIIINPESASEVDSITPVMLSAINDNDSLTDGWTDSGSDGDTPSNSVIQGWFNVFGLVLNVLFPFHTFFTGFIDPSTCASVPIIASWVHSPNSTYCSWWPSNVITTLTPVFVLISNMILFGFIVSWLRGDRAYSIFKEDRSSQ